MVEILQIRNVNQTLVIPRYAFITKTLQSGDGEYNTRLKPMTASDKACFRP